MQRIPDSRIAAAYVRKSRQDGEKSSLRLTVQREQLPAQARKAGWQCEIYDDGHASASIEKLSELKERARLEKDIAAGKIGIVYVIEISRLSRDDTLQDYMGWLSLLRSQNVKLATLSRVYDLSEEADWMILLMEGGFNSIEMRTIQKRMKQGRDEARNKGMFLGGIPPKPYIYDYNLGRPVVCPDLLAQMERLWSLAEKQSAKAIAKELGLAEIAVRRAIGDERLLFYQALRVDPSTGEFIRCEWEPVMTSERATRIQAARRTRRKNEERRHAAGLLSNLSLLYCGYCGHTVKTWNNSKIRADGSRLDYYGCQTRSSKGICEKSRLVPRPELESRVLRNLFGTLESLEELKRYWLQEQARKDYAPELQDLRAKEKKYTEEKKRLLTAVRQGLEFKEVKRDMAEINRALEEIDARRNAILTSKEEEPDWTALDFTIEDFQKLDFIDQRLFLKTAMERIEVYETYAIVKYPFPRDIDGDRKSRVHLPVSQRRRNGRINKEEE